MFKSRLRGIYEKLACPYSAVNSAGMRKCTGYREGRYTCNNPLAHLEHCGIYRTLEGITYE